MPLVKYVAEILGYLMNGIYLLLDKAGIPNVALAIILFTIVMYLLMTPLQISQQRFSKLNAVMSPEIQKVQAKYKGKKDQISQQKMLDETNAIYAKYGVNQAGSCIQLLIQMPVLFALYQVIYHIPGYIGLIGDKLRVVAEDASFVSFFTKFVEKLPEGINSEIKERGGGFSEGQAQRLSIARAIIRKSPILLLDEATSALDVKTERRLLKNIMKDEYPRTCIVTTHRPTVLTICNRVYEIKDKKLNVLDDIEIDKLISDF